MNRRTGVLYTLLSIVVLLALLTLFVLRLNNARSQNVVASEASFQRLVSTLSRQQSDLEALAATAQQYFNSVDSVRVVALYFPDRGVFFLRSREDAIMSRPRTNPGAFTGYPDYTLSEVRHLLYRERFLTGTPAYVDVVHGVLSSEDLYLPLRDTLFTLLIFAFITVVVVVLAANNGSRSRDSARGLDESPAYAHASVAASRAQETAAQARKPSSEQAEQGFTKPVVAPAPETHEHVPRTDFEEVQIEEIATDPAEPGTMFNPTTGLSFRRHLDRKLGLELQRAAYDDQDLSCMLISFDSIRGPEDYVERAEQVLSAFQFEDLCFEYDDKSFFAILPNTELPQAIRQASTFKQKHGASSLGLSARNGRLVEASRVIREAERSLDHARSHDSGIVGFRPDPKKYRQFVSENLGVEE